MNSLPRILLLALCVTASSAHAQLYLDVDAGTAGFGGNSGSQTWDATTTNWSTSAAGDIAPVIWADGAQANWFSNANLTLNLGAGFNPSVAGLDFSVGSGGTLTLAADAGGNSLSISAGGITNSNTAAARNFTIEPDILLTAPQTWSLATATGNPILSVDGDVNLATHALSLNSGGETLLINGAITGSGDIANTATGGFVRLFGDLSGWTGDLDLTANTGQNRTEIAAPLNAATHVTQAATQSLVIVGADVTLTNPIDLSTNGTFGQGALTSQATGTVINGAVSILDGTSLRSVNASDTLTFGGTVSLTSTANETLRITGAGTTTFNTPITDDAPGTGRITLQKGDAGTLIMNALHTYDNATTIQGGLVQISNLADSGTASHLGSGNTVNFGANFGTINFGTLRIDTTGSTNRTFSLQADAVSGVPNPGNGGAIEVTAGNEVTLSGQINRGGDAGSEALFHKTGAGTLLLTRVGSNSFDGHLSIKGGALLNNTNLASVRTTVVESGATLGGDGTLGGTVTLQSGSTISPGASLTGFGLLTLADSVTFETGSTAAFQIGGSLAPVRGTDFDALDIANALVWGGDLSLSFATALADGTHSWDLFNFASESGDLGSVTLGGVFSGGLTRSGDLWSLVTASESWSFDQTSGILGVTVVSSPIPEPSRAGLLMLAVVGILGHRRRAR